MRGFAAVANVATAAATAAAAACLLVSCATAEEKERVPQYRSEILDEDLTVRVELQTYEPGALNESSGSGLTQVQRALSGGTLERRFDDGRREKLEWRRDAVRIVAPMAGHVVKNVGTTPVLLYVVIVKI